MSQELIQALVADNHKYPEIESGDTVKVHVRIVEGARERVQVFPGCRDSGAKGRQRGKLHRAPDRQPRCRRGADIPLTQSAN